VLVSFLQCGTFAPINVKLHLPPGHRWEFAQFLVQRIHTRGILAMPLFRHNLLYPRGIWRFVIITEAVQNWVGTYLSYQDTFVWRKITFLWSDSKNWGAPVPLAPPLPLLMMVVL